MNKAIVVGAFGFLGYGVTKAMLEEGMEVIALSNTDEKNCFKAEKRMEVGRNANFIEDIEWGELHEENEELRLIIPLYDFYMNGTEKKVYERVLGREDHPLFSLENCSVTYLLPYQVANEQGFQKFKDFMKNRGFSSYQEIYFPTLYGPWQPDVYYFQQVLAFYRSDKSEYNLSSRESIEDAIYIEDAASIVLQLKEDSGKFVVHSGKTNGWMECFLHLCKSLSLPEEKKLLMLESVSQKMKNWEQTSWLQLQENKDDYHFMYVKEPMEIQRGIKEQQKQYEHWQLMNR